MPEYICPKCYGTEYYQVTELVSTTKGGGAVIGPENEFGFSPIVSIGGGTTTSERTVIKCKACNIVLGQENYYKTASEIRLEKEREIKEDRLRRVAVRMRQARLQRWKASLKIWSKRFFIFGICAFIIYILFYYLIGGFWPDQ